MPTCTPLMPIEGPPCTPFVPAQCPLFASPMRTQGVNARPHARRATPRIAAREGAAPALAARAGAAHAHQPCVRAQVPPAQVSHACAPAYAYYVIPSIVVFSHARLMPTMFAPHAHHGTVPWWASAGTWKPSIEFIHILPCPPKATRPTLAKPS